MLVGIAVGGGFWGTDNLRITPLLRVPLTTIAQPKLSLGKLASERLLEMINNPKSKNDPKKVVLKPELIIRESCKKIN